MPCLWAANSLSFAFPVTHKQAGTPKSPACLSLLPGEAKESISYNFIQALSSWGLEYRVSGLRVSYLPISMLMLNHTPACHRLLWATPCTPPATPPISHWRKSLEGALKVTSLNSKPTIITLLVVPNYQLEILQHQFWIANLDVIMDTGSNVFLCPALWYIFRAN